MNYADTKRLEEETTILVQKGTDIQNQTSTEPLLLKQLTPSTSTAPKECIGDSKELKIMEESEEREMLSPLPQPVAAVVNDDDQNLVMVSDPPLFVREMRDQNIKVGSRTRFFTEILTGSPLSVNWLLNGVMVEEGSRYKFYQEIDFYCLEIFPVLVEDDGTWTCQVWKLTIRCRRIHSSFYSFDAII